MVRCRAIIGLSGMRATYQTVKTRLWRNSTTILTYRRPCLCSNARTRGRIVLYAYARPKVAPPSYIPLARLNQEVT
jgi:hypothetical protein